MQLYYPILNLLMPHIKFSFQNFKVAIFLLPFFEVKKGRASRGLSDKIINYFYLRRFSADYHNQNTYLLYVAHPPQSYCG